MKVCTVMYEWMSEVASVLAMSSVSNGILKT